MSKILTDKETADMFLRIMEFHSIDENDVIRLISSHNKLKEKFREIKPWVWDDDIKRHFCMFCDAKEDIDIEKTFDDSFIHQDNCIWNTIKEDKHNGKVSG